MNQNEDYRFDLAVYAGQEFISKVKAITEEQETPFLVVDLKRVAQKYDALEEALPEAKIYYAVKANPHDDVLRLLIQRGTFFDFASPYELDQLLFLGADPEKLSYGNPIKKARHIAYVYKRGVRLFACDSESDLKKIAENAPGSRVFFRILTSGEGADWPLSRKFGAEREVISRLIPMARDLGVIPAGISFHVGSQQKNLAQWEPSIAEARALFDEAAALGIKMTLLNLGGGFPARYLDPLPPLSAYRDAIMDSLHRHFPEGFPELIIEPGRYMVGEAGVLVTEVVMIANKSGHPEDTPWMFLDAGKFGGLAETLDEAIKYPIYSERTGAAREYILAGPTCDSADVMYEKYKYRLPVSVQEGDYLYIFSTGAYTSTYSSIAFNGLPPLATYVIDD